MEFLRSVIAEEAGNSAAIKALQLEHTNRQRHITALEERLEEIHDHLRTKLKALDAIQEKNANLQQEIASLKGTLGYIRGTEATHCQLPSTVLHLEQHSEPKPSTTSKPSQKVLYSQFMNATSAANLFREERSSRVIAFPAKSLLALDKILAPSCSAMLQNQGMACPRSSTLKTDILGQGQDYITYLFAKSREPPSLLDLLEETEQKPPPAEDSACSAIGNLKIAELHPSGRFVKIINNSPDIEEDIGDYILLQNLNGHPISTYKFPPRIRMKANSEIKVWSASSKMTHKPPIHFLWKNLDMFILGPQCTTILCDPSGQAVAWYTPIHRNRKPTLEGEDNLFNNLKQRSLPIHKPRGKWENRTCDTLQPTAPPSPAEKEKEPEFIIREEKTLPLLYPVQSPWCRSPSSPTHPHYSLERYLFTGSDWSSTCRQTRSQSAYLGPDPDVPCTGLSQGMKLARENCKGEGRRSTRSAGPNLGGVMSIGSATPISSALQKYFAHSSYHLRLLAHASPAPINFL
ncbi:lamin tail domain-containing protein 1 [Eublepharis macularius]|uniref:Lamin tail domain-containing protein 1 n=1 Tax=Eublepharis macularius TaxID=481883 RepID=A0AA97L9G3_EUBMA|nr:lamin tail domain-containing protein 1 [Eublepharis macularius]